MVKATIWLDLRGVVRREEKKVTLKNLHAVRFHLDTILKMIKIVEMETRCAAAVDEGGSE